MTSTRPTEAVSRHWSGYSLVDSRAHDANAATQRRTVPAGTSDLAVLVTQHVQNDVHAADRPTAGRPAENFTPAAGTSSRLRLT
jgi:hypothetical protein